MSINKNTSRIGAAIFALLRGAGAGWRSPRDDRPRWRAAQCARHKCEDYRDDPQRPHRSIPARRPRPERQAMGLFRRSGWAAHRRGL